MAEISYMVETSPVDYFPTRPARVILRLSSYVDGDIAGFLDHFYEDGWMFAVYYHVREPYRHLGMSRLMAIELGTRRCEVSRVFAWAVAPEFAPVYDELRTLRPDMTWAASGGVERIDWAEDDPLRSQ